MSSINPPTPPPVLPEKGRVARPLQHQLASHPACWSRWLAGWQVLRHYELAWLPHDVMAGLLAYALFGPSRILVLGPDSTLNGSQPPSNTDSSASGAAFGVPRGRKKGV